MRMMIVDDDIQIRRGISYGIQWEKFGIEQTDSFSNAIDALHAFRTAPYDIVITDIRMPEMNGIELLEKLKAADPDTAVILLSGYEEFEYAKAGIRYGAEEYILKPIHVETLIDTVSGISQKIKKHKSENISQKETARNQTMRQLLAEQTISADIVAEFLEKQCGLSKTGPYLICAFQSDQGDPCFWEEQIKQIVVNRSSEYLAGYKYCAFEINGAELMLLIHIADSKLFIINLQLRIRNMLIKINQMIREGISISAGMYAPVSVSQIIRQYAAAKDMLCRRFFLGKGCCLTNEDVMLQDGPDIQKLNQLKKEFVRSFAHMGERDIDVFVNAVQKILFACTERQVKDYVYLCLVEIANIDPYVHEERPFQNEISKQENFETLMDYFRNTLRILYCDLVGYSGYSKLVCDVIHMIKNRYPEKITVDLIAEELQISTAQMGKIFKKETGTSVKKYLNVFRIEKAKQLLLDTNLRVYEIAEMVGIPDYLYFTQVFKSVTSVSPTDIRNRCVS